MPNAGIDRVQPPAPSANLVSMFLSRLATLRLDLVSVASVHALALFETCHRSPDVTRYLTWRPHATVEETVAFVERARSSTTSRTYVLVQRVDAEIVGTVRLGLGIGLGLGRPFSIEIGYLLAPNAWGRGLMPEAIRAAADWAFAEPGIFRFAATCDVDNHASARALEKAGLVREGILRRWMIHPNLGPEPRDGYSYSAVR